MQGSVPLLVDHVVAAGALAANRCVTFAGAYPSAAAAVFGVTRTAATAAGDLVPADISGTSLVESGGVVTAGGAVKVDATGRIVDQGGTGVIVGRALTAAAAAGTMVNMQIIPSV